MTSAGPTLVCPLCRTTVSEGVEPAPGTCPTCAARYAGGGDDARGGVAAALAFWGIGDLAAETVTAGLFGLVPGDALERTVVVTSDRRDGFYRWWVFVAAGADLHTALAAAAARTGG